MSSEVASEDRLRTAREKCLSAESLDEKGRAFQDLVAAFFEAIPGIEVQAREQKLAEDRADLVLWNDGIDPIGEGLDRVIIVECKAREKPIGQTSIREMVHRIKSHGLHSGVLATTSRFSKAAQEEARRALSHDQVKLLLLDRKTFAKVRSGKDARDALKRQYADLFLK